MSLFRCRRLRTQRCAMWLDSLSRTSRVQSSEKSDPVRRRRGGQKEREPGWGGRTGTARAPQPPTSRPRLSQAPDSLSVDDAQFPAGVLSAQNTARCNLSELHEEKMRDDATSTTSHSSTSPRTSPLCSLTDHGGPSHESSDEPQPRRLVRLTRIYSPLCCTLWS